MKKIKNNSNPIIKIKNISNIEINNRNIIYPKINNNQINYDSFISDVDKYSLNLPKLKYLVFLYIFEFCLIPLRYTLQYFDLVQKYYPHKMNILF